MQSFTKIVLGTLIVVLFGSSALVGQDIPIGNWTVPAFDANTLKQSGSSIQPFTHTQGDHPAVFVPFGPCRLTDSRVSSGGPGPIPAAGTRDYDFVPSGCPAIPGLQDAQDVSDQIIAWSLNFTVLNTQGPGFLFAYPTGGTPPAVSILNYSGAAGELRNNAAIVPTNESTGSFTVVAGVSGTDVIIDANGVFLAALENFTSLRITSSPLNPVGSAIWGENPTTLNSASNGAGVLGTHAGGGRGVWGAVQGSAPGATGVRGNAFATSGNTFGVMGLTSSVGTNAAGVKGVTGYGDPLGDTMTCSNCFPAGVRGVDDGASASYGVLGISRIRGVGGVRLASTGTGVLSAGFLGAFSYGVYSAGNYGGTGTKYFVEPHPTDPSLVIKYISLEGPEAGTYFRGRGKFDRGTAIIEIPEDFRMVTDGEGLSIQVTPIGEMATVAVLQIGLDRIVVKGSRNVEFFYMVNGVRRTFKNQNPIQKGNGEYTPEKADATLPGWLSEEQKRLLIQNGTYEGDGTVNMETARRLGWDRMWQKREEPSKRIGD